MLGTRRLGKMHINAVRHVLRNGEVVRTPPLTGNLDGSPSGLSTQARAFSPRPDPRMHRYTPISPFQKTYVSSSANSLLASKHLPSNESSLSMCWKFSREYLMLSRCRNGLAQLCSQWTYFDRALGDTTTFGKHARVSLRRTRTDLISRN